MDSLLIKARLMKQYVRFARQELLDLGYTPEWLKTHYPKELKRMQLALDMGEIQPCIRDSHLDDPYCAAKTWLEQACVWPPKNEVYGIAMPILERCWLKMLQGGFQTLYSAVLSDIPAPLHTEALRLIGVRFDPESLRSIPMECLSEAVMLEACKRNGLLLQYIPDELQSEQIRLCAITQTAEALQYIPADEMSDQMVFLALRNSGMAIQYVPESLMSEAICLIAIQQNYEALCHIPKHLQTRCMHALVLSRNGESIRFIDPAFCDDELRLLAVLSSEKALSHIPYEYHDEALLTRAITFQPKAIAYAHEEALSLSLCHLAVSLDDAVYRDIPVRLRAESQALALQAVRGNGCNLKFVPSSLFTPTLFIEAVDSNGWAIKYVPEQFQTHEMQVTAISHDDKTLEFIPGAEVIRELVAQEISFNFAALHKWPDRKEIIVKILNDRAKGLAAQ